MNNKKIITVAGARPNFMKVAPILRLLDNSNKYKSVLVHTGQHYDHKMSDVFFKELDIRDPNYHLDVKSGSHAQQTAKIMVEFEEICLKENPDLVIVVGDVNSTLACSVVAKKLHIKVAHVEAGLRSKNNIMQEEINRVITDRVSKFLFCPTVGAKKNLIRENFNNFKEKKIFNFGDVMLDIHKRYYPNQKL